MFILSFNQLEYFSERLLVEEVHLFSCEVTEDVVCHNFRVVLRWSADAYCNSLEVLGTAEFLADRFEAIMSSEAYTWLEHFCHAPLGLKTVMDDKQVFGIHFVMFSRQQYILAAYIHEVNGQI